MVLFFYGFATIVRDSYSKHTYKLLIREQDLNYG